ncbi:MAG: hypothetical protein IIV88_02240, partial [Erysipelotrichaceae bacterium]|nr:hypothetical protein [Erysipelotrichaceae bacterium]
NAEGKHVYAHSRKDGKPGYCYLIINNSLTDEMTISLPKDATVYTLDGNGNMRNKVMYLNPERHRTQPLLWIFSLIASAIV